MRVLKPASVITALLLITAPVIGRTQAALLLEQPYGFFGALNPTGHAALYLARVCADTPLKLRWCRSDESGVVLSRYGNIDHYDWVAIPTIPYFYSVENIDEVPKTVNHATVQQMRNHYHEQHLLELGEEVQPGGFFKGGWTQLVGASYERRVYAFRFDTSEKQDQQLMDLLNDGANESHFELFYNNCSDFDRKLLNIYFPGVFKRTLFPDAGATTPKKITDKLVKYTEKHPESHLQIFMIPQIPGYRRHSSANHGIAESLVTTGYAIPMVAINPYLAGGLFVDYLLRGRSRAAVPKNPQIADPEHWAALTVTHQEVQNPSEGEAQFLAPTPDEKASPYKHE